LEVRGTHLAGGRVSQEVRPAEGNGSIQPCLIPINVLENSADDKVLVEAGPGVGNRVWIILENEFGKTRFTFGYSGEQD
jgi:hypothetical protein